MKFYLVLRKFDNALSILQESCYLLFSKLFLRLKKVQTHYY